MIRAARIEPVQRAAETLLEEHVKRWKLAEVVPSDGGTSVLEYLIRSKDPEVGATLIDAFRARGDPDIVAVEFRSLPGLKPGGQP